MKANKPEIWEERKKKEAEDKRRKYLKISQLSKRDKEKRRKQWRELKKNKTNQTPVEIKKENRRSYKKKHYRLSKENKNLKMKIESLKKQMNALKKKVYRCKLLLNCQYNEPDKENVNHSGLTFPLSKTESFIQKHLRTSDRKKLKRALLEKNILIGSLESTYKSSSCNQERQVLKRVVNNTLARQYKLQTHLSSFVGLKGPIRVSKSRHEKPNKLATTIANFYLQDDVSRATSGKKETKTMNKEKIQKRYLLANLTNIYKKFKEETGINVSYTTFVRYKPFYVLRPKVSDRDTYVCKKHANIEFKFIALKKLQVLKDYSNLNDLINALVCDAKSQQCMYSKCVTCKTMSIMILLQQKIMTMYPGWSGLPLM